MLMTQKERFSFCAMAAMNVVALATGAKSEQESAEIKVQIYKNDTLYDNFDFCQRMLDWHERRLKEDYQKTKRDLFNEISESKLTSPQAFLVLAMAVSVMKSNPLVASKKVETIAELADLLEMFSDSFVNP